MTRFEAFLLLRRRVRDRSLVRRCLAAEAVLEDLAARLGGDVEIWGLAGLLHEVDAEFTENNPKSKGAVAADIVRSDGGPAEVAFVPTEGRRRWRTPCRASAAPVRMRMN
jgi:predicted hydrolase (HD superfamily)